MHTLYITNLVHRISNKKDRGIQTEVDAFPGSQSQTGETIMLVIHEQSKNHISLIKQA